MQLWLIDLLPTFTDLAGLVPRQDTDGKSLLRLLQGNPPAFDANRQLFWENSNRRGHGKPIAQFLMTL